MYNKVLLICILLFAVGAEAQDCKFVLSGYVLDKVTEDPLELVTIYVPEIESGAVTDENGYFILTDLCKQEYHLTISHIGCESKLYHIDVAKDSLVNLYLEHTAQILDDVIIDGTSIYKSPLGISSVSAQEITDRGYENISNILSEISGVSTLKNGNGIAKPMVHGLYGNRLTMLNNGIPQSGQQWGNDHSPEIDPLASNKIKVIKGASALQYKGGNMGSVILTLPERIADNAHLHGKATYFFESNGLGNGLNVQLEKNTSPIAWKINTTLKKIGDRSTPDYYLNNTGAEEANIAIQLEKKFSDKCFTDVYFSSFNTKLGVLRGSQVGNLTDLEEAFERKVPFYTEDKFSYDIDAPRQQVNHHLAKIHAKLFLDDSQWIDLTLAGQLNDRKEFDVRRLDRSDIAALDIRQYNATAEAKYTREYDFDFKLEAGLQSIYTDNTNNPQTGILPLIPDYISVESGLYLIGTKQYSQSTIQLGIRYDNNIQNVVKIENTVPKQIVRYNKTFNIFSGSLGWQHKFSNSLSVFANLGWAERNPAINELYSAGLHQGVSGIEEGSVDLVNEKALLSSIGANGWLTKKWQMEVLLYAQLFDNYIYLSPQDEIRLTIRGAFPLFKYEQTDANITGLDFTTNYHFSDQIKVTAVYSYIRGRDKEEHLSLVYMPANSLQGAFTYAFANSMMIGTKTIDNVEFEINNRYVASADRQTIVEDFVAPPGSYNLIGMKLAGDIQLRSKRLRIVANVDNLTNVAYRDYLNRQRYFADDLGINVSLGLSLKF